MIALRKIMRSSRPRGSKAWLISRSCKTHTARPLAVRWRQFVPLTGRARLALAADAALGLVGPRVPWERTLPLAL